MSALGRLPIWLVVLALAAVSAAGVAGLTRAGFGVSSLGFLAVPIALGLGYLLSTRSSPEPAPADVDEEPFEDPVELADREDQARGPSHGEAPGPEPPSSGSGPSA